MKSNIPTSLFLSWPIRKAVLKIPPADAFEAHHRVKPARPTFTRVPANRRARHESVEDLCFWVLYVVSLWAIALAVYNASFSAPVVGLAEQVQSVPTQLSDPDEARKETSIMNYVTGMRAARIEWKEDRG